MRIRRLTGIALLAVLAALAVGAIGRGEGEGTSIDKAPAFTPAELAAPAGDDWLTNGGGVTNERYSTLQDINTANVGSLKLAWQIHLGSGGTRAYSQEA